ncbi:MAG: sugar transferase [Terracidiphilus sp.]|jgi:lipopolysaccharide/colanic/teichoic acid biosynthesis glycosyltransferase
MGSEISSHDLRYREDTDNPACASGYEIQKRVTDVLVAALATAIFAPLMAVIAIAVKLSSQGPVFFVQPREVGRAGKVFALYKFRTMRHNSDSAMHRKYCEQLIAGKADTYRDGSAGADVFKIVNDPRITRLGRILRRTGLDELPQLINVLKGDMSVVGPRPAIWYEYDAYTERQRARLSVLPGITGLAQVTVRNSVPFETMIDIDLEYIRTRSWWLDLTIMAKTAINLVLGRCLGN